MDKTTAVDQLIQFGYLKYVYTTDRDSARAELIGSLSQGYLDTKWDTQCISRDKRTYPADWEELAEGGLGAALLRMRDVLQAEGVLLERVDDELTDDHYTLAVNGIQYPIYDSATLQKGWIRVAAIRRLLEIVNNLLQPAGSPERLYGVYGGNDGRVILLTQNMLDLLHSPSLDVDPDWMPYPPKSIREDGSIER